MGLLSMEERARLVTICSKRQGKVHIEELASSWKEWLQV